MIALLTGSLAEREGARAIIDVRGVGYEVFAANATLDQWSAASESVVAHIYTQVSEDTLSLYGFVSREQRTTFVTLLRVSGVGPKVALAALDALSLEDLSRAVDAGDYATLSRIKGVGKKTAQRMALELKGKLPKAFVVSATAKLSVAGDPLPLALDRLGYSKAEIARAESALEAQGIAVDDPVPTRLRAALAVLSGGKS